ncbi:MAG: putative Zn-dependent hydrolase [Candidatus Taylorbacteria bacterium]|nr:putative Zn-dependent hydrolase [Candidatus Taylorbacteria bacterium]
MKITKYGHCCLLVEEKGVRVLTDPGSYTTTQNEVKNIDVVLITHEHGDHFHIESVKEILKSNPETLIVTNNAVNELLKKENILNTKIVEDGESFEYKGIKLSGYGKTHAIIYQEFGSVENTGYMIGERLYYPADAFHNPQVPVEILALPVAGPWMKISEAIDFALEIKPKKYFAVHDGGLNESGRGVGNRVVPSILQKHDIEFVNLEINTETEF